MAEMRIHVDDPDILEDLVVGTLKQLRDIDEPVIRERWQQTPNLSLQGRVMNLVGNNGYEYNIIMSTVEAARAYFES